MSEYLIQDSTLTNIADAIRNKTGETEQIVTNNMATKIREMKGLVDYENTAATEIPDYCFYKFENLRNISFTKATKISSNAFNLCTNLKEANFPLVTIVSNSAFYNCPNLVNINIPEITSVNPLAFFECSNLEQIILPKVNFVYQAAFSKCEQLKKVDFGCLDKIGFDALCFTKCTSLKTVIFRSNFIPFFIYDNINAEDIFDDTPIVNGTGYIYVPDDLVDSYKANASWGVLASQIKPLSEYIEE